MSYADDIKYLYAKTSAYECVDAWMHKTELKSKLKNAGLHEM